MRTFVDRLRIQNLEARLDLRRLTCYNLALELYAAITAERRNSLAEVLEKCLHDMEALQAAIERLKQSRAGELDDQLDEAQRS
jgi:cell division protein FtsB